MTSVFAPSMAQDVKSQVEAIKKVVTDNKSNPAAAEEQVKDFVKENKKNAEALAGLGRAYFEIKDTASAREYAMMAIDRGKDNKGKALAYILLGDIAALSDEGGGADEEASITRLCCLTPRTRQVISSMLPFTVRLIRKVQLPYLKSYARCSLIILLTQRQATSSMAQTNLTRL